MRPAEARQISMARSSAQSECGELSTRTNTSLYGMTPPSAVMGSLNEFRIAGLLHDTLRVPSARYSRAPAPVNSRAFHLPRTEARFSRHAREAYVESLALCARSCSSRDAAVARRARYGQL